MSQAAPAAGGEAASSPIRGMIYLSGGLAVFTVQDVIMKQLSGGYPLHEMGVIRTISALPLLVLMVWAEGGWRAFVPVHPRLVFSRAILGFFSYTSWYLAIAALPLGDAATIYYSNPILITALAAPFLGEIIGWRRWAAVTVGFVGVVIVMQPGGESFDPALLLAFASALFYSIAALITRRASGRVTGSSFALWATIVFGLGSAAMALVLGDGRYADDSHASLSFLTRAWAMPGWYDLTLLLLCGPIAAIAFYCLSQAYLITPASVVTPFEYSSLPWAILFGFLIWGDVPGLWTWVGLALIVGSGLYVVRRESVRGRAVVTGTPLQTRP